MISETQVAALSSSKEEAPQYEEIDDRLNVLGGSKAKKNKKVVSKPSLPNKETPRQKCNGCGKAHKDTQDVVGKTIPTLIVKISHSLSQPRERRGRPGMV